MGLLPNGPGPFGSTMTPNSQPTEKWPCPYCPKSFGLRPVMRRRVVAMHSDRDSTPIYDHQRDSLNGMPQCRHCKLKVFSRYNLKQHIERNW